MGEPESIAIHESDTEIFRILLKPEVCSKPVSITQYNINTNDIPCKKVKILYLRVVVFTPN